MRRLHRAPKWLHEHIRPALASFLRCSNLGVLPIIVGTAVVGAFVWACAFVGWLMPDFLQPAPISPTVRPPWFDDPESFLALSGTGLITLFSGSVCTVCAVLFLVLMFFLGNWVLHRKLDLDSDKTGTDEPNT